MREPSPHTQHNQLELAELVSLEILQNLQDGFADSYKMPAVIYGFDGAPITQPSNFTPFCKFVRSTPKGNKNCEIFDADLMQKLSNSHEPIIRKGCALQNIITGTAPIIIEGKHFANFGIGQMVDEDFDLDEVHRYAKEIGMDENELLNKAKTLIQVTDIDFKAAVNFINILAQHIGKLAEQKLQQNRLINERTNAVNALQISEKRFRFLAENARELVYRMVLPSGEYEYVSPASLQITGYTPEEYYADKTISIKCFHPDWQNYLSKQWELLRNGIVPPHYEYKIIHKSGVERWLRQSNVGIKDKTGKLIALEGIVSDITDQKQMEVALRTSEEDLRSFMDNAQGFGVYQVKPRQTGEQKDKIIFASPSIKDILGIDDIENNSKWYENIHAGDLERVTIADQESGKAGQDFDQTIRTYHPQKKEWRWVRVISTPVIATDGTTSHFNGLIIDVTDIKRAEAEIEKLSQVIETAVQSVVLANLEGKIIYVNQALLDADGFEHRDELIGTSIFSHSTPQGENQLRQEIIPTLLRGDKFKGEITLVRKDNSTYPADISCATIANETGQPEYLVAIFSDITERKIAEENRLILEMELNQSRKLDAIGQLAGGIAHDFNNMIGGILGAAQLLKLPQRGLDEKSNKLVDLILSASERAADLTAKLLAFGRKTDSLQENINVHSVIKDTAAILTKTIDKAITISLNTTATNDSIVGDNTELQNIFINLGINASHAMPDGGNLSFETRNIYLDQNYCEANAFKIAPGDYIEIAVKDTGCGIDQKIQNKIFEPFFTTKEQGKGTGLGLAAIYGTIQNHHGAINVYSEIDTGTVFRVYLPTSTEITKPQPLENNKKTPKGSGKIILIDDEEIIRITGTHLLKDMGYKVFAFDNGLDAIEMFKKQHLEIDLIITDMIMPKINGSDTFYKLREIDSNCKVIISSGFTREESIAELKAAGLAGFIKKPFKSRELASLLEDVLVNNNSHHNLAPD